MKTLVIVVHPDIAQSKINSRWAAALKQFPEKYTVHDLYAAYPDEQLDVAKEQALLLAHDKVVFQFPFYWFNCPPLLKKWLDEVLTHGWAYGKNSEYLLAGKKMALSISAGINEDDYSTDGRYKYSLAALTAPFQITFEYIRADYRPLFAFYGAEHHGSDARIEQSTSDYLTYLDAL
ncbi:NAD(P)H-dependent oxidoreductase [Chitinophaga sp. Cy-1792]|uniref:NAD(P)H-dependent oxidoreductase n=1 Tax=Chitinophaga sp. Cy-1792 TaxID=2608339 RepID=UPI001421C539|nr:NAD(P)H-dependent oxidoreductase [Chitinophaga sp. Cy-1792]NIG55458.1 NAD(P)H-dependent oxidoreductase [Chitinophaga sp. Cy-1792]